MFGQDDDNHGLILGVVFGVVAFAVAIAIAVGVIGTDTTDANPAAASAAGAGTGTATGAPGNGAELAATPADVASVKVDGDVVKFYFATGRADLAMGADDALAAVVQAVSAGKKAVISGYTDATGDAAKNAELAKQRALAVRAALVKLGVPQGRIEMRKPESTTASGAGSGSNAEARRVEVTAQ